MPMPFIYIKKYICIAFLRAGYLDIQYSKEESPKMSLNNGGTDCKDKDFPIMASF